MVSTIVERLKVLLISLHRDNVKNPTVLLARMRAFTDAFTRMTAGKVFFDKDITPANKFEACISLLYVTSFKMT